MTPTLVEIKQNIPGFERFIGSWVFQGEKNVVIDVGPSHSVRDLIGSLLAMGMDRVDWVLLTHIHIDHAGGLAEFLARFPSAKAVCHNKAIKHLVDPSRLWAGTKKTLGPLADHYGPIRPVAPSSLVPHQEAALDGLDIIETPGHAAHHLSFIYQGHLLAGEAGGVYATTPNSEYLRPATPPVFFLHQCLESIDRLLNRKNRPICYGHFGQAENAHAMLERARNQLILWENLIKEEIASVKEHPVERCMESLLSKDPELRAFKTLDPPVQERERFFIANSIKGYLGFLGVNLE
jgi:glyoxylase-like metal-dependent hydrolase (beta-lactamase superfamily II)